MLIKLPFASKRPAQTLLFITEVKTFRIDTDSHGIMMGVAETITFKCPNTGKIGECVNFVIANTPALGKKVWILYVRLPMSLLTIPTMQVEGLEDNALLQALQFELDSLTGQPPLQEQQLAHQLLSQKDEMNTYWITQIDKIHLDETHLILKKAGSRLLGLLHPAAMLKSIYHSDSVNWLRFECWSQQLVAIHFDQENGLNLLIVPFADRNWSNKVDQWANQQGFVENSETLLNNKIEVLPETAATLHLNDADAVSNWLTLWANVLNQKDPPNIPILTFQSNVNTDLLLMASGGAGALVIVLLHVGWNFYQIHQDTNEIDRLSKIETSVNAARKNITDTTTKIETLKARIEKLQKNTDILPDLIQGIQNRPANLLAALSKGRTQKLLVETIDLDKEDLKISGLSLDSTSVNDLSNFLEQELKTSGWAVETPTKKNLELFNDGGPWEFEIKIQDLGLEMFNTAKPEKMP